MCKYHSDFKDDEMIFFECLIPGAKETKYLIKW